MQISKSNWSVGLNEGDAHPICVKLGGGFIHLDLQIGAAATLVSLLNPSQLSGSIESQNGWCDVTWHWLDACVLSTHGSYTSVTLSKYSAALLAVGIEQMMHKAKLGSEPDLQSADSLGGPMRRMDDNLRRVFG